MQEASFLDLLGAVSGYLLLFLLNLGVDLIAIGTRQAPASRLTQPEKPLCGQR